MDPLSVTATTVVAVSAASAVNAVSAASQAVAHTGFALFLDGLYYFIMVPLVYLSIAVMALGIVLRIASILAAPAPAFSPDGEWIVFNSQRTGNAEIYIMRPNGLDVRQLTDDPDPDWQPRWGR